MKFKEYLLKDIATITMGQSPKSQFYNEDGKGIEFLQGVRTFGEDFPYFDTYTTKYNRLAYKNSILFSVRAPVGRVNWATKNIAIGRGVASISVKNMVYDRYVYYYFKKMGSFYDKKATGTVFTSINKKELESLKIKVPASYDDQKRIADRLATLDRKIHLNQQLNANLLELISLIQNEYSRTISNKVSLKSLAQKIITGKTPSTKIQENYGYDIPFVKIPDMHDKVFIDKTGQSLSLQGANSQKNKYLPANAIMVSCIGTPGLVSLTGSVSQTNQQINSLILEDKFIYWSFLELRSLRSQIGNLGSGGTTINNLNKSDFSKLEIIIPDNDEVLDNFNHIAQPIFERIHTNNIEIRKLTQLKEALLNKLF